MFFENMSKHFSCLVRICKKIFERNANASLTAPSFTLSISAPQQDSGNFVKTLKIPGCQVPIFSYFFLFFGLPPIFSYFFMKFLVFPLFLGFSWYTETFWNIWNKLPMKWLILPKNGNFMSKKTSLKLLWVIFFWNSCLDFLSAFDSM